MTQRKPPRLRWETWIDRQVRESSERGEFEDLPGAGEPIADLDKPRDEMWWVKGKLRREGLTYLPPSLALRKEADDAVEEARRAPSEAEARRIVEGVNERIREANRQGITGPRVALRPYEVGRIAQEWRERHAR
jgi:DnaJ homologue, subfamily C, member 28, conserved domain